jgi:hypothetical protein
MLSLINSMQPNHVKIDLDLVPQNKNNSNKGKFISRDQTHQGSSSRRYLNS